MRGTKPNRAAVAQPAHFFALAHTTYEPAGKYHYQEHEATSDIPQRPAGTPSSNRLIVLTTSCGTVSTNGPLGTDEQG